MNWGLGAWGLGLDSRKGVKEAGVVNRGGASCVLAPRLSLGARVGAMSEDGLGVCWVRESFFN